MIDPVTISLAVGAAGKAFSAIKAGFAAGRDLEQMSGDLSRWMGAVSDVDNAEKQAKNPGVFDKLFGSDTVESAALQAYANLFVYGVDARRLLHFRLTQQKRNLRNKDTSSRFF